MTDTSPEAVHRSNQYMFTVVNGVQNTAEIMQNEVQNLNATVQVKTQPV